MIGRGEEDDGLMRAWTVDVKYGSSVPDLQAAAGA